MESFVNKAIESFRFLTEIYGFSEPEVNNMGGEMFVSFHRNDETVSVSMEAGSEPFIELFLLCEGRNEVAVPWAERNGKQRFRKFPKIIAHENFFIDAPKLFEAIEHDWLKS